MALLWINDQSGSVNQYTNPGLIKNNEFEVLVNTSQQELGTIAHRLGSDLFLNSVSASNAVRGLNMYEKPNGSNYLHMVHDGTLYVNGASTWTSQDASEWSAISEIDMVNFIGRHYMASSVDGEYLHYATETGATTIPTVYSAVAASSSTSTTLVTTTDFFSSAMVGHTIHNITDTASAVITAYTNPTTVTLDTSIGDTWDGDTVAIKFDPKYLAVNGPYMMGVKTSTFPRRCYWSNVDSGTFTMSTDFVTASAPPTGVASFGNGRSFVIFTKNSYMVADPGSVYFNEFSNAGCVSHRSIQNVKGVLIYLSRDGFNALSSNSAYPTDISRKIKNDLTGDAFFNKINPANLTVTAAGKKNDTYFCAVRDLSETVRGQTLDSAMFVVDTSQNNWKVDTYTGNDLASVMAEFTDSTGATNLYGGSFSNGTVYKMHVQGLYTDDDTTGTPQAVTSTIRTKHFEFFDTKSNATAQKRVNSMHFKYKAASAITVKYSVDGNDTYTTFPASLPIYSATQWTYKELPFGKDCKTFSLEFSCAGDFKLYGYGVDIDALNNTGIREL